MRKMILLILGLLVFSTSSFSQQKGLSQKDSGLLKPHPSKNLKLSDSTRLKKNNNIEKGFSIYDSDEKSEHSRDTTKVKNHSMPVFTPKGSHRIRLHEVDTTQHYSLRIIRPEKIRSN